MRIILIKYIFKMLAFLHGEFLGETRDHAFINEIYLYSSKSLVVINLYVWVFYFIRKMATSETLLSYSHCTTQVKRTQGKFKQERPNSYFLLVLLSKSFIYNIPLTKTQKLYQIQVLQKWIYFHWCVYIVSPLFLIYWFSVHYPYYDIYYVV